MLNEELPPVTDAVWRALGDPTRRAIFERLARGEATVSDVHAALPISQSAVSQHLAVLRRAGLVAERHAGRNVFYHADPAGLLPLVSWIDRYQTFWRDHLDRLTTLLKDMDL